MYQCKISPRKFKLRKKAKEHAKLLQNSLAFVFLFDFSHVKFCSADSDSSDTEEAGIVEAKVVTVDAVVTWCVVAVVDSVVDLTVVASEAVVLF